MAHFRDDPARQCVGKRTFWRKRDAKLEIRRAGLQGSLTAYRCPHCGRFHLGHKMGKRAA